MLTTLLLLVAVSPALAQVPDARQLAPWLDLPTTWVRVADSGRVVATPNGLAPGDTFVLWVEPPAASDEELLAAYDRTTRELGVWRPVHPPSDYRFDTGWVFHVGTGVVAGRGKTYTTVVAVARNDRYLARFWALAGRDDTYNHYQSAVMVAISSVQDIDPATLSAPLSGESVNAAAPTPTPLDPAFGAGISGVYLGLERGLRAHAGAGYAGAPQVATSAEDYLEVDVLFPDGRYRRRLPDRGLASDLDRDQATFGALWGTWALSGDSVVVRRGSYVTTYLVHGDGLQSERDRPWRKLPAMHDTRLEGVFVRPNWRDADAPRLVLHADGTYEDRGDFLHTVGTAFNLVVPDGDSEVARWSDAEARHWMGEGSGTYTLEAYTLTLRDRDGRVWQFNAYVPPAESDSNPQHLVINQRLLIRQ